MSSIMKSRFVPLFCATALSAFAQPALTVYNQGFAVVRERVPLDLKAGENAVTFAGATAMLEADSVVLRDPAGKVQLRVLEQSYRADVMSQGRNGGCWAMIRAIWSGMSSWRVHAVGPHPYRSICFKRAPD
jgi:hypothetical protein